METMMSHPNAVTQASAQMSALTEKVKYFEKREGAQMPGGSPVFPTTNSKYRLEFPVVEGFMDYFPLAIMEVARYSKFGNDKHNPGQRLHWAKGKSFEHANNVGRHLLERGTIDPDSGFSHTVALAWRAMALLQKELEAQAGYDRDALEK